MTLKHFASAMAAAFFAVMPFSCTEPVVPAELDVTTTELSFDKDGGSQNVTFSTNMDWTAISSASWVKITGHGTSADPLTVTVDENPNYDERTATVTVRVEDLSETVTVRQSSNLGLLVTRSEYNLGNDAQTIDVEIQYNVDYEVVIDEDCKSWITQVVTKALETGTVQFNVAANTSTTDRSGKITISQKGGTLSAVVNVKQGKATTYFDQTNVACSFAMVSDTHINGSNTQNCEDKLRNAFSQLSEQAKLYDASGLDGVVVAGDLIDYGGYLNTQLPVFKSIYESAFDPVKVPLVYTIGNHDPNSSYWWSSGVYAFAKSMRSVFGSNYETTDKEVTMRDSYECRHCVVGGYHILAVTPNSHQPVSYPSEVISWLDKTLKTITDANPEQYVIVITHPMIYNTVYGSLLGPTWLSGSLKDQWSTSALTPTLKKYPQVMTFGGHLHFPINDPRSIWQGDFTSFGCGSTRYMAIEDGSYENMSSQTVMKDCSEISSGLLLQFDRSGNARITRMFFSQNTTFGKPWELTHPQADKSHLKSYNHSMLKSANTAPTLSNLDVTVADYTSSLKTVYAKFSAGQDDEFVHHYVLQLKKGSSVLSTKRILSDFYKHSWPSQMSESYTQTMGNFENGTYTLVLQAYDSWDAVATLTKEFTIDGGTVTPVTAATLYADIDFAGGSAKDAKGKLEITNKGASIGKVNVSMNGKSASVEGMTATKGNYVECKITELSSTSAVQEFASKGFSVEALYVDKKPGTAIHGIVCGTEYGGWGLAVRATGVPYFIVGDAARNTYVNVDASGAASTTDLTHIVGVYDFSKRAIRLYVNGSQVGQASLNGSFYPGENNCHNIFCLGADATGAGRELDFSAENMIITDAKLYTGVMDDAAVKSAYDAAAATIK